MCAKQSLNKPTDESSVNVIQSERCIGLGMRGEVTNPMKPEREIAQAVMRKREGYRVPSRVIDWEGRGAMESRRQHLHLKLLKRWDFPGVQVHGMCIRSIQELGRSPQDTGFDWSFRSQSLKRKQRLMPRGEVRSVRSSETPGLLPVAQEGNA